MLVPSRGTHSRYLACRARQAPRSGRQGDADAIGLSVLSGAHMTLFAKVVELLKTKGAEDVVVFGGGIIPEEDIGELERLGVRQGFTPGAPMAQIVEWVRADG